jgi:hypothetical protein
MPATAAIDNETLDHLLSVVDDGNQYTGAGHDSKALVCVRLRAAVGGLMQRPPLLAEE